MVFLVFSATFSLRNICDYDVTKFCVLMFTRPRELFILLVVSLIQFIATSLNR